MISDTFFLNNLDLILDVIVAMLVFLLLLERKRGE